MVHLGSWHSVRAFETLVPYSRQVHVCSLLGNLNALELSIMEIIGVVDIPDLSWVHRILQFSVVLLVESLLLLGVVLLLGRLHLSNFKVRIDGLG